MYLIKHFRGQPDYKFCAFKMVEIEPRADEPRPKARSGHRIVYYDGRIYSFGGYNPAVDAEDDELSNDPFWAESRCHLNRKDIQISSTELRSFVFFIPGVYNFQKGF